MALSRAATGAGPRTTVAVVDVRRAYFYAPTKREVFVELPPEDWQAGDEEMCGLLRVSLYGTRDAAQNWEEGFARTLEELGFRKGKSSPAPSDTRRGI